MGNELIVTSGGEIVTQSPHEMVTMVKARMQALAELMRDVMVEGIDADYAEIPGTHKKSLLLPGAQKISVMFGFVPTYEHEDMSTATEARYRVKCILRGRNGDLLGDATAEWSSHETNNQWRKVNSDDEYDDAAEDERRIVNKKAKGGAGTYKQKQIRVSRADAAIKGMAMAEKRAYIRAVRAASGASAIFTVHVEEMPEGMAGDEQETRAPVTQPRAKASTATAESSTAPLIGTVENVSEKSGNKKDGSKWTRYGIMIGGEWLGTFDSGIASVAQKGVTIRYTFQSTEKGKDILSADPVMEGADE